ncbi:non-ribosomal peptide synthetase [Pseudomonas aegrilactucae]|uniref:Amino acid adenylation domain-containing protein n=1 Tax=Pseudomonas aegrilactucae TaxID=2854028 RepID=A0A9Q3AG68_9PSED|nr:non-ribosomal peptide synthetase [Pseudomonas aegrilactucae]MBV6289683.1 amino acid adenylation domain-containing protein [Pseudomonas aegrilactucae]
MNQMNHPTDDDLLALLLADEAGAEHAIRAGAVQEACALSFAQQRLWFLQQFDPRSCAYNLPRALRLSGELNADVLEQALNAVIDKHDILRTRFVEVDNLAQQQVDRQARLTLARQDLGELPAAERDDAVRLCHEADLMQPFDLSVAPLMRGTLLRTGPLEHVLLLNMHHIVSDAWSNAILLQDLAQAFAQGCAGAPSALQRPAIQYADYAHWQRQEYPLSVAHEQAAAHWKQLLDGELPNLDLPFDTPRSPDQLHPVGNHTLSLPASLSSALQRFCQQHGLTPFIVLLGAWQLLLGRYTGQHDFTVGVPNATRSQGETQALVGCFVSSQVYRARLDGAQPASEFLQRLREQSLAALEHADYPIELILEDLQLQRSTQANPLFQTLFNWRVASQDAAQLRLDGLDVEFLGVEQQQAKFDLSLEIDYSQQQIDATFSYSTALFLPQTMERLASHWQHLLQGLIATPQLRLGELPMLDRAEQQMMLDTWNATAEDFGAHANLQALFEAQVHATPDAVAVRLGTATLTYQQLNLQANRLAHKLLALGVGADVGVGIACERSLEMVIGLLAVLKAGGAYVPLDPSYPQDRLAYMIEHSGIELLLTQTAVQPGLLLPATLQVLLLDHPGIGLEAYADSNPTPVPDADNLAYIIYTSGSTGRPKGVQVRHGALTNHMLWMQRTLQLHAHDRVLQKTAFSFDASVWEFWLPLLNGAQLVLASPELNDDLSLLWPKVQAQGITVLQAAPSLLQALMAQADRAQLASLRAILLGGEALSPVLVQQLRSVSNAHIYNLYGPSEATIDTCCLQVQALGESAIVPIGQPISNVHTHILDHDLNPCAIGVSGELLIGGLALARGYHARPGLTAERFIPDPIAGDGTRLYRSGDLAHYRDNGVIEYVGRIDHQIKLHGLRIELGEIEARLLQQPQVAEAVVLAPEYLGSQRLVAYIVASNTLPDAPAQDRLRHALIAELKQQLPGYMVPAHLVLLDRMPLTRNGKLDRKALPLPDAAHAQHLFLAPQSAMERQIAALWQEVLKQPQVGLSDNFFELGGDSIVSIQVVSRARQAGIRFTPKQLFQHQTVQSLARVAQFDDQAAAIDQGPASGTVPLLPIQQAFFDTPVPSRHHWNQSVLLKPAGPPLDAHVLEQALDALLNHHDALRLSFTQQAQGWSSVYRAPADAHNALLQAVASDDRELEQLCERAQRSLDLEHGPLLRALLVSLADGRQRLLLVAHHLVIDGVSWRILFDDLQSAYQQCLAGQAPQLPARTSSLQAFAHALREHAKGPAIGELDYWLDQHQAIAADLPDAQNAIDAPAQVTLLDSHLDSERTRRLLQQAPAAYRTQVNDLLLSALARVLARWTGQADNLIQLEGHGREELHEGLDLTRTVGWFTSAFPLKLSAGQDLQATIKRVKEQLRGVPDKGIGFGALRYLGGHAARDALQALPAARITFNYLGQFDTSFDDTQQPLLVPASEAAGAEKDPGTPLSNWLSINGQVYAGELSLSWTYDQNRFAPHLIERLADDYIAELGALIDHCCDSLNQGATPSDFPLAGLDQAQLDALPIDLALIDDLYPLSPLQQGMLFHTLYEQDAHDLGGAQLHQPDAPGHQRP